MSDTFARPGKWYVHAASALPSQLAPTTLVDVKLRDGTVLRRSAHQVGWHYDSTPHPRDVVEWRVIPDDEVPPAGPPGAGEPSKLYDGNCRALKHGPLQVLQDPVADALDDLAALGELWARNRQKGRMPSGIRVAMLAVAREVLVYADARIA